MARLPRLVIAGLPHLLSQRAQHAQTFVRDDEDRLSFLRRLRESALEHRVAVHAYAMLDTRFDILATPEESSSLSRFMQSLARRHAAGYNRRHGRSGGLWEGRFRAAPIEPQTWLLVGMLYVELLPERLASTVPMGGASGSWSSADHHRGEHAQPWLVDPEPYWALGNTPFERELAYRERLQHGLTTEQFQRVDATLRGGWALGSEAFVADLVKGWSRPLVPRPSGRPPKKVVAGS